MARAFSRARPHSALRVTASASRGNAIFGGAGVVDGIALGAGEVLVRYTLNGDTDLNRTVNFDDLLRRGLWAITA